MWKNTLFFMLFWCISNYTFAGVDLTGKITKIWLKNDDKLWFTIDNPQFDTYCKPGWFGFNLYIPKSDKDFPYYYGLISSANAKGQSVRISNISVFDGSTACNVIQTGYGIVVHASP